MQAINGIITPKHSTSHSLPIKLTLVTQIYTEQLQRLTELLLHVLRTMPKPPSTLKLTVCDLCCYTLSTSLTFAAWVHLPLILSNASRAHTCIRRLCSHEHADITIYIPLVTTITHTHMKLIFSNKHMKLLFSSKHTYTHIRKRAFKKAHT